jgi:hypothetical protein
MTTWRAERTHFWCEDCTRWLSYLNQPDHEFVHQSTSPVDGGPAPTGTPLPVGATNEPQTPEERADRWARALRWGTPEQLAARGIATDLPPVVEPGSEPPASGGGSSRPN